ncbi:MAG: glutamate--tRNA ligase, partial [Bdellovibrionales bacterium]|nr:glutamate--tRNA ligase [Bdellovibrionales bacterium]
EMIKTFSTDRLHVSGAVFDRVKLKWMNAQHLRAKPENELWSLIEPFLKKEQIDFDKSPQWQAQSLQVFKPYLETLVDAIGLYRSIDDKYFQVLPESKEVKEWESSKLVIEKWKECLSELSGETLTEDDFLKIQDEVKVRAKAKGKFLFMPMRVAVIGKPHGTELKILVPLMSKSSLIHRAEKTLSEF